MIIAIKTKKGYLIGQDITFTQDGYQIISDSYENDQMFPLKDDKYTIIAVDEDLRQASFLKYVSGLGHFKTLDKKTMVRKFVPKMYEELTKMKFAKKDKYPSFDGRMIVAKKDKAWNISKYGFVAQIADFEVIGKGEESALGYLHVSQNEQDPMKRLLLAFYEASKRSHTLSLNILIADTSKPYGKLTYYSEDETLEMINKYLK